MIDLIRRRVCSRVQVGRFSTGFIAEADVARVLSDEHNDINPLKRKISIVCQYCSSVQWESRRRRRENLINHFDVTVYYSQCFGRQIWSTHKVLLWRVKKVISSTHPHRSCCLANEEEYILTRTNLNGENNLSVVNRIIIENGDCRRFGQIGLAESTKSPFILVEVAFSASEVNIDLDVGMSMLPSHHRTLLHEFRVQHTHVTKTRTSFSFSLARFELLHV